MSSRHVDYLVRILRDCEEELVRALSDAKIDAVELSNKLFQSCIITSDMSDNFTSLDHSRVDTQLQIRYLLRLVSVNIKSDVTAWDKFIALLDTSGKISDTLMGKLKQPVSEKSNDIPEIDGVLTDTANGDARVDEDIVLNHGDVGLLTELLVEVSQKWEEISISLGLLEHDRADFQNVNVKIRLNRSIACWISRDSTSTLKELKQALKSKLVGEGSVAHDLVKKFKEAKKQSENSKKHKLSKTAKSSIFQDTNFTLTISNMTGRDIKVADGKSTLFLVQVSPSESVSYQWKKNGQFLVNDSTYSGADQDILVTHAIQGTEGEYTCCVSRQGREVCSNNITLTVIYHPVKKRLLNLYSTKSVISKDSWPPIVSKTYITLALIKSSKGSGDNTDYSVRGDADDIIAKKEKVKYEEAFGEYKSRELILLEGRPGSGKTTLVHKIIKDWANGKILTKAKLVFLIILRVFNSDGRDESLSNLFELFSSNAEELVSNIDQNEGEGVCFVIDGLDEYQPQNIQKSVIHKLLDKTCLPQAMIIVSSRPATTTTLKKDIVTKRVEVFGFSKHQIFEYIDNFPFSTDSPSSVNDSIPAKLKEYLVRNPNIFDMCYLPVHAAMICFLFEYDKEYIAFTQTKIYEHFTRLIIHRHLTCHNVEIRLHSLKELSGVHKKYFDDLCHLAFTMTINSKQVMTPQELGFQLSQESHGDEYSLGLVTIFHSFNLSGLCHCYAFLHLTFQEFLAAYHIANLNVSQQMKVIKKYRKSGHLVAVWTFFCGLANFHSRFSRFEELINHSYRTLRLQMCYGYESQQQNVCDEVVKKRNGSLQFYSFLTPTDLQAIGYVLTTTSQSVTELLLRHYYDDDRITILLEHLSQINLNKLKYLSIYLTIHGNEIVMLVNILKSATNLYCLTLHIKNIGPDDTERLVDQMKHFTNLTFLLLRISAPPESINVLAKGLSFVTNVSYVNLSFEALDAEGALALSSGLQLKLHTNIAQLDLSKSSIGSGGAAGLAKGLQYLTKLCKLNLSYNNIENEGFNSLCIGLQYLTSLRNLNISHNNISADDKTSFASLQVLTSLQILNVSHNKLGSDGAISLVCALQHLTNLRELNLSHNKIRPDGATSRACALQHLTNLRELNLSHNKIGPVGATSPACALEQLTNLRELDLSDNNIGPDGATSIACVLQHLPNLRMLDLSYNNIDLEGAKIIISSLNGRHISLHGDLCIHKDTILVCGLVYSAIADLVAAAENNKPERTFDLVAAAENNKPERTFDLVAAAENNKPERTFDLVAAAEIDKQERTLDRLQSNTLGIPLRVRLWRGFIKLFKKS